MVGARGYFERLRDNGRELEERKTKVQEMRAQLGSRGARYGTIGSSGNHDATAAVDRVIEAEQALAIDQARHDLELEQACAILYGRSGRGGLARERGTTDADIICCSISKPDSDSPVSWCRQRASRALRFIDSVGADVLADS